MNYLAKFGWDSSKGLGASKDGRISHLKVSQKLDMLGIGSAHQRDPNGIAWKQNNDFENLLKRLNGDVIEGTVVGGFKKADNGLPEEKINVKDERKRKRGNDGNEIQRKKKNAEKEDEEEEEEDPRNLKSINPASEREMTSSGPSEQKRTVPTFPRHRAYALLFHHFSSIDPDFVRHRARAIAAKNLSSKSAAHISEILGISSTPTYLSTTSSGVTSDADTPQDVKTMSLEIEKITTSTKSVHEYFKERLRTKKPTSIIDPPVDTLDCTERDTSHETPRGGLGSSSRTTVWSPILPSTFEPLPTDTNSRTEVAVETKAAEELSATQDTDKKVKKKKRSKVKDEQKSAKMNVDTPVSEDEVKNSVVGECHLERPLNRKDKNRTAAAQDPPANLTTQKKERRRKREKRI